MATLYPFVKDRTDNVPRAQNYEIFVHADTAPRLMFRLQTCKTQWDKHQRREILGRRERW